MKKILTTLTVALLTSSIGYSQTADIKIKDVPMNDEGTTISIGKKGTKSDPTIQYQITEGEEEVTGDPAPLLKEARINWKKACDTWKKETKDLNKDNQVITLNCGKMECTTAAMETTCKSNGTHKIKVKMN